MEAEGSKIMLSNEVQSVIDQVLQSFDPLDKSDFNSTGAIIFFLIFLPSQLLFQNQYSDNFLNVFP